MGKRIAENNPAECYVCTTRSLLTPLSVVREKSSVEPFYRQEHKESDDSISVTFVDDVYMLFNQQRLDRMTGAALSSWLDRSTPYDSGLRALRSRMSDEQLGSFIKSRYIQSRSELLSYSSYLESQYPDLSQYCASFSASSDASADSASGASVTE